MACHALRPPTPHSTQSTARFVCREIAQDGSDALSDSVSLSVLKPMLSSDLAQRFQPIYLY